MFGVEMLNEAPPEPLVEMLGGGLALLPASVSPGFTSGFAPGFGPGFALLLTVGASATFPTASTRHDPVSPRPVMKSTIHRPDFWRSSSARRWSSVKVSVSASVNSSVKSPPL